MEEYKRFPWVKTAKQLGYNKLVIALLEKARTTEEKLTIMSNARKGMYDGLISGEE